MIHNTLLAVTVSNPVITLSTVIWCIYIGAVIGWAAVLFNKFVPGTVVRRILSLGLFSPDKAMTVDEMKIKFPLLRYMLRDGSSLRRTVKSREEEEKDDAKDDSGWNNGSSDECHDTDFSVGASKGTEARRGGSCDLRA